MQHLRSIIGVFLLGYDEFTEFLAIDRTVRVWFPAVPDFLRSNGSETGHN
jgi:hypothetical protein